MNILDLKNEVVKSVVAANRIKRILTEGKDKKVTQQDLNIALGKVYQAGATYEEVILKSQQPKGMAVASGIPTSEDLMEVEEEEVK